MNASVPDADASGRETGAPVAAIAIGLLEALRTRRQGLVYMARSERRAALLARLLSALAPEGDILWFPAWDCVPYDRAAPSRDVMGRRVQTLRRLAMEPEQPFILVTTPDAFMQRVPPRSAWAEAELSIKLGDPLSAEALERFLVRTGYILDERVDEPGEAAIRGAVIDLFPAGAADPVRLDHAEGRVTGIRCYDAISQRTLAEIESVLLTPASELVQPEAEGDEAPPERFAGMEHWLPDFYDNLETLRDYAPNADILVEPGAEEEHRRIQEQVEDAHETRRSVPGVSGRAPIAPSRLYVDEGEWASRLKATRAAGELAPKTAALPRFARAPAPAEALAAFIDAQFAEKRTIVLAAASRRDRRALERAAKRETDRDPVAVTHWEEARAAAPGSLLSLAIDIDAGFLDPQRGIAFIGTADVFGRDAAHAGEQSDARAELGMGEAEFRLGDMVVHIEHGMAMLKGIETVAPGGEATGDTIVLEFADEAKLLLPAEEMSRIWRYGGDSESLSPDRLGGAAWPKKRAELETALDETARQLVRLGRARKQAKAESLAPSRRDYERFASGFPYAETPDQARAIDDVLEDLASGRPMNRLVCGDVGFGKTEVALRAAAAAVLAGKQVAVVAPTTVLVRQHVRTFRARFAGFGIEVAHLSRLVKPAEARAVKQGISAGDTPIIIGTHALSGKDVRFKDLGLLIIDEEQRFGAKQKEKLRALGKDVHVLTLTATPIPRTLERAMIGLQDLSIVATPPTRRQPVRTFLTAFDPVTVRAALMRERRRGGQSFVVCPRIEDIGPMAKQLKEVVPELHVVVAHGKMPAEAIDASMVDFADGVGDVLLATNIIESGLDVPRANTILIWRADRFGLSQLHQLRGRVGRGRARGTAYLLTDPAAKIGRATEQRLRTLEALDRLGAGFAISGRDLDHRGAGDLLGEEQAGHVKLIGMGLYQHLLERALAAARGEPPDDDWVPVVHLGLDATVPEDYVPEPEIRINLYARLARLGDDGDPDMLGEEIGDRFGPVPEPLQNLIAIADLRRRSHCLGIERLDAGPQAIALTFRAGTDLDRVHRAYAASDGWLEWRGERLVAAEATETPKARRKLAGDVLDFLERPPAKAKQKRVAAG